MVLRVCIRELVRSGVAVCAALVLSFLLVHLGSGFGVDERSLDIRFNDDSQKALRDQAAAEVSPRALLSFIRSMASGDFGTSATLGRPVAELVRERAPETLPALALAWIATIALALAAALASALRGPAAVAHVFSGASAFLLSIPCAVLALVAVWLRLPVVATLVIAVLPQAYRYALGVLDGAASRESVIAARSRGIGGPRLWIRHALLPAAPELLGVLGLTASLLISAVIPVEALTGAGGLGHLVWQAALGRDLPLIASMTLLVALGTLAAGSSAEIGAAILRARRSA